MTAPNASDTLQNMSTRSAIIHKTETGYEGIYCHSDGYLSYNGFVLFNNFKTKEQVAGLIKLGDLSCIDRNGSATAYHRDRGENYEDVKPIQGKSILEVSDKIGHDGFVYVFENDRWTCNGKDLESELSDLEPV